MDIGTSLSISSTSADVAVLVRKAEDLGFESCWVPEHTIVPVQTDSKYPGTPDGSIPPSMDDMADPLIALARASAVTSTIKLGTSVSLVPEHNPLLMAKQIATLDRLSNGRFIYGIGAGWLKEETEIMGGDFEHRWGQSREAVMAMKELWIKDEAEFHGRFYDFPLVKCSPKPLQKPHPPVYLGGSAARVFQRVVAYGDGWMPVRVNAEQVRAGRAKLDELAEAAGRDPKSIRLMVYNLPADRDLIQGMEEAGADRVVVPAPRSPESEVLPGLERLAEQVLP